MSAGGYVDACGFLAASSGTGDFVVSSAVTGYQTPASAGAVNATVYSYRAESADKSQWEIGFGAYVAGTTKLARTTITANSAGNTSAINFSAAPNVFIVVLSKDFAPVDALAYSGMQVNGSMDVDQAHAGAAVTGITGSSAYVIDCWQVGDGGSVVLTGQQVTDAPPGYSNSLKVSVTTAVASLGATDYAVIVSQIEGYRTARLAFGSASAQSLSVGFWVKAHRTGTYSGTIRNGAANRCYPFTFAVNSVDTWEFKTLTLSGDTTGTWLTTNGVGLIVTLCMACGSTFSGTAGAWSGSTIFGATGGVNGIAATTDTFQVTGVLVLPGIALPSATRAPLIMRPFDQELMLCKRYYQKSYDYSTRAGNSGGNNSAGIRWPANGNYVHVTTPLIPEMRTAPTFTVYDNFGNAGKFSTFNGSVWADNLTPNAAAAATRYTRFETNVTAGVTSVLFDYVADARL